MYVTKDDLIKRFGEREVVALAGNEDEVIDDTVVETALADAEELINSYVAVKYALPLSTVPAALKRICCDMARYFMYKEVIPEELEKTYERNLTFLKDIAKGVVTLGDPETGQNPEQAGDVIFSGSAVRHFSQNQLKGF